MRYTASREERISAARAGRAARKVGGWSAYARLSREAQALRAKGIQPQIVKTDAGWTVRAASPAPAVERPIMTYPKNIVHVVRGTGYVISYENGDGATWLTKDGRFSHFRSDAKLFGNLFAASFAAWWYDCRRARSGRRQERLELKNEALRAWRRN